MQEERRRTGRYVATVIAIFVSLFGLYQAMARGTPEYAAFFLPALIMFFYVLWILYASRSRGKVSTVSSLENLHFICVCNEKYYYIKEQVWKIMEFNFYKSINDRDVSKRQHSLPQRGYLNVYWISSSRQPN